MFVEKKRVIALGFFDGVHIGHSALLERVTDVAKTKGLVPSVITFDTHPLSFISDKKVQLINSSEDRAGLIHRIFDIDDVIFLHFDYATAHMPYDSFVYHLTEEFGAQHLVAGHNFTFGHKGEGNAEKLADLCAKIGIGCDIIPPVMLGGVLSSSTHIRKLIEAGDVETASAFLGHPHVLTDVVRYGYRLGRTIGTPTINMTFADGVLIPQHGVYATRVYGGDGNDSHIGVTNVGVRPTVASGDAVTAETHILDYQGNLYGHVVRIEFFSYLRSEKRFDNIDLLKTQIALDCDCARAYFSELTERSARS